MIIFCKNGVPFVGVDFYLKLSDIHNLLLSMVKQHSGENRTIIGYEPHENC